MTRLSLTGEILDPTPHALFSSTSSGAVDAAWDGTHHVVVDGDAVARVSAAGTLVTTSPLPAPASLYEGFRTVACRDDGACLTVGVIAARVVAARISKGVVVDASPIDVLPSGEAPRVAWSGSSWVVVSHQRSGSGHPWVFTMHATRIAEDGSVLGDTLVGEGYQPDVACSSGSCRLAFASGSDVRQIRIDGSGAVTDGAPISLGLSTYAASPRISCGATQCLVVSDPGYVAAVRTSGASVLDTVPHVLSLRPNEESHPIAASAASGALVVWSDTRSPYGAYGLRVSASGVPDPVAQRFGDAPRAVAGIGSDWLFVSTEAVSWIDASGSASAPAHLGHSTFESPRAACTTTACLVVWIDTYSGVARLYRSLVPKLGSPGPEIETSTPTSPAGGVLALAASPTGFLVVQRSKAAAWAIPIDGSGVPTSYGFAFPAEVGAMLSLAWVDDQWIAATTRDDPASSRTVIEVIRLGSDLKALDPAPLFVASGKLGMPAGLALAPSGDGHTALLTWDDGGVTRGAFVTSDGRVLDPAFVVAEEPSISPAVAAAIAPGKLLVTRVGVKDATRVFARFVESGALDGESCSDDGACASRYCVDGHCCDRACSGTCETCGTGKCTAVVSAEDPDTCTGDMMCGPTSKCGPKNGTACTSPAECASGFCVDGVCCDRGCGPCGTCVRPGAVGTCAALPHGEPSTCTPFVVCDGVHPTCPTTCAAASDCAPDAWCDDGRCEARTPLGDACNSDAECAALAGHCVDGVCCSSACTGVCEACDLAGSLGTCSPIEGAPRPGHGACAPSSSACGTLACDGVARDTCAKVQRTSDACPSTCADGVPCAPGLTCVDGACVAHPVVDATDIGSGGCAYGVDRSSGPRGALAIVALLASLACVRRSRTEAR